MENGLTANWMSPNERVRYERWEEGQADFHKKYFWKKKFQHPAEFTTSGWSSECVCVLHIFNRIKDSTPFFLFVLVARRVQQRWVWNEALQLCIPADTEPLGWVFSALFSPHILIPAGLLLLTTSTTNRKTKPWYNFRSCPTHTFRLSIVSCFFNKAIMSTLLSADGGKLAN